MLRSGILVLFVLLSGLGMAESIVPFVKGNLIDAKTENPIEDVRMTIQNLDSTQFYKAKTDEEGVFEFKNIPEGDYKLIVTDRVYNRVVVPFTLDSNHLINGYTFTEFPVGRKVSWMFDWGDKGEKEHYWSHFVAKGLIIIYFSCLILIFFYSILQLSLAITYMRKKKRDYQKKLLHSIFQMHQK